MSIYENMSPLVKGHIRFIHWWLPIKKWFSCHSQKFLLENHVFVSVNRASFIVGCTQQHEEYDFLWWLLCFGDLLRNSVLEYRTMFLKMVHLRTNSLDDVLVCYPAFGFKCFKCYLAVWKKVFHVNWTSVRCQRIGYRCFSQFHSLSDEFNFDACILLSPKSLHFPVLLILPLTLACS